MDHIATSLDLGALWVETELLPYSHKYDKRVEMSSTQGAGVNPMFGPRVREAVAEIEFLRGVRVLHVQVNRIQPGVYVDWHVDPLPPSRQGSLPRVERWHLPVRTDPLCLLSGEHLCAGYWHGPVKYWEPHDVQGGQFARTHIIVDLDNEKPVC